MAATKIEPVDPDGLLEFSVVFTDRSLNHMSTSFQAVMRDISATLKDIYGASSTVIVPGGGTYGMESVARQFATSKRCVVLRNGYFSYRWTQIFEMGDIPAEASVLKARRTGQGPASGPGRARASPARRQADEWSSPGGCMLGCVPRTAGSGPVVRASSGWRESGRAASPAADPRTGAGE